MASFPLSLHPAPLAHFDTGCRQEIKDSTVRLLTNITNPSHTLAPPLSCSFSHGCPPFLCDFLPCPSFSFSSLPPPSLSALPTGRINPTGCPEQRTTFTYFAEAEGRECNELKPSTHRHCACVTIRDRTDARIEVICS
jgi:hypothetical protein